LIPRLVIATKNPDKVGEMEAVLAATRLVGEFVRGLDWPEVDETGSTLEENALIKARAVALTTGLPALGDDTGLEVEALDGAPGIHARRFAGPEATYDENVTRLLELMEGVGDRAARFRTVVALVFPDGVEVTAEGSLEGTITTERRGEGGFGYDPVFLVGDGELTAAELDAQHKNEVSHRGKALRALVATLTEPGGGP
jgi:XTP/dITP diphosphohydrolase